MNEKIKTKTALAALAALAAAALFTTAASAQVAQAPAVGHTVVPQEQPRLPQLKEIPVRLSRQEMSALEAQLSGARQAGKDSAQATVDYGELGKRRGTISRSADGGLFLTLSFPAYEWPHGEGIQSVQTYLITVDAQGRGAIRSRDGIYGRDCADTAACEPVAQEFTLLQAFDAPRIVAQLEDFWRHAAQADAKRAEPARREPACERP
jgi:hypothetical protein